MLFSDEYVPNCYNSYFVDSGYPNGMPSPNSGSDNDELARGVRAILHNANNDNEAIVQDFAPQPAWVASVRTPTRQGRKKTKIELFCVFCYNNGEIAAAMTHRCKDKDYKVICPKLRRLVCPTCGETGENAHTIKYCPKKTVVTMEDTVRLENLKRMQRR